MRTLPSRFNRASWTAILASVLLVGSVLSHPVGAAADGPSLELTVGERGSEPRTALRYDLDGWVGQQARITMRMSMGMEQSMGGETIPIPAMPVMIGGVDVRDIERTEGGIRLVSASTAYEVEEGEGIDPAMAAMLRASLPAAGAFRMRAEMDARGNMQHTAVEVSTNDPMTAQLADSFSQNADMFSTPLPEEAVGAGATWTVRRSMDMGGVGIVQEERYTLREVTGTRIRFDVAISQSTTTREMEIPGMPGQTVSIVSFTGTGSGRMTMDLASPGVEGSMQVENRMELAQRADAPAGERLVQVMRMGIETSSAPLP
ncbi:MAG: hypothetical protein EA398_03550 [Deltaproteobacteria bacterium]|nr:MAG: hypothetical protein EA398_03550 [Deltaproteobacteria bacterium]